MEPATTSTINLNTVFLLAVLPISTWLTLRPLLWSQTDGRTVAIEWISIIALTGALLRWHVTLTASLRIPIAAMLVVIAITSINNQRVIPQYAHYWRGFGRNIAIFSIVLTVLAVTSIFLITRVASPPIALRSWPRLISSALVIGWTLPSLLQPMDAWLNIGDSTEKVLDELMGWTVLNIPGVHTGWSHTSLLGLPLAPLSFIPDVPNLGEAKIILVALYANLLLLMVPLMMALIIKKVLPGLGFAGSYAIGLISVTMSGSPINTSLFQEIAFLGRGFLPLLLAWLLVFFASSKPYVSLSHTSLFSALSAIAFWNNYEYGFGAGVACLIVILTSSNKSVSLWESLRSFTVGFGLTSGLILLPGLLRGGNWLARRFGSFGDVFSGEIVNGSYNSTGPIPAFGLPSLTFSLAIVGVAIGYRDLRSGCEQVSTRLCALTSLYFGVWTIVSLPYFLNGGGAGGHRTQFLMIPFTLLASSILGAILPTFMLQLRDRDVLKSRAGHIASLLPIMVICSVTVAAVLQVPNGLKEWRRIQTPLASGRPLDEWSPEMLDFVSPTEVVQLSEEFGGPVSVGWWYQYGNAIEALTGVENLLGITGFEGVRSGAQLRMACDPVIQSSKEFLISFRTAGMLLRSCDGIAVNARTIPNEDGLIVFEVLRL